MRYLFYLFQGIITSLLMVVFLTMGLFFVAQTAYRQLYAVVSPDMSLLKESNFPQSSKIYAKNGELLYEFSREIKRSPVALNEISPFLQKAVVAIEDKDFYWHKGISVPSIICSAEMNFLLGKYAFGGSTITQQVVKSRVLSKEKTFARKISEAVWAIEIEKNLSKQNILEIYLNSLPFTGNIFGVEAAALTYFGKPAKNLSLAESAYLASIPNAPSLLNPSKANRDLLDRRKNKVLELMLAQGYINSTEYEDSLHEQVKFNEVRATILAPNFVFYIEQTLLNKYGEEKVYRGGIKVFTTLDLSLQALGEQVVREELNKLTKKYNNHNAGLVAIDPKSGNILAMVGSKDYYGLSEPKNCQSGIDCKFDPNVNVTLAKLQPGSSFKPYVYATAFDRGQGFYPGSVILDVSKNFSKKGAKPYVPKNYNFAQYGRVSLRKALAGSLNIATVRLASEVGLEKISEVVKRFGLSVNFPHCGLSSVLGSCEITLLEHTAGFAGLANLGKVYKANGIIKILDSQNNILELEETLPTQAVDEQSAYEVISILTDSKARQFIFGKNSQLSLPERVVMAKTGTTQNWKDGWTLGATPDLAVGVWTGNNNGQEMKRGADGIFTAAPIWQRFMKEATFGLPSAEFARPNEIKEISINPYTGKLASLGQRQVKEIVSDFVMLKLFPTVATEALVPQKELPKYEFSPAKLVGVTAGEVWQASTARQVFAQADVKYGTRASLYVDDQLLASIPGPEFSWQVPAELITPGEHTLRVLAVNQAGYRSEDKVKIIVAIN